MERMIDTRLGAWLLRSPFVPGFAAWTLAALHTAVVPHARRDVVTLPGK
jgi:hypothetical protein